MVRDAPDSNWDRIISLTTGASYNNAEPQIRTETPFYMATSSFQDYFLTFRINSSEVYVESSIRIELISYIALAVKLTARSTYTNTPLKTRTFLTSFGDWYST